MTVASSGEGATLDGKRETRLFSLSGGCSLTLRGLTLVNGRAEGGGVAVYANGYGRYGGVVYANGAGDVEIIESVVRDCSATFVRRVELAAGPVAPHGSGARGREGYGSLTPLSPRNRSTAASSSHLAAVRSR